jgi:hypothetical protein
VIKSKTTDGTEPKTGRSRENRQITESSAIGSYGAEIGAEGAVANSRFVSDASLTGGAGGVVSGVTYEFSNELSTGA